MPTDSTPTSPKPRRTHALLILIVAAGLTIALFPFDGPIAKALTSIHLKGDIKRELEAWQQFGALGSVFVTAVLIALLDPRRARRLLDLLLVQLACLAAVNALKNGLGRPRPIYGDPSTILTPWGLYPVPLKSAEGAAPAYVLRHAWESSGTNATLWSLPSSHTLHAAALAVFLATLYPRLRPLLIVLVILVALTRIITGAHWPTDVILGAGVGAALARLIVIPSAGVRLLDWFWIRFVDRTAAPRHPVAP